MSEERDQLFDDHELRDAVRQFEQMLKEGRYVYMDAHQFESIIDFYLDMNNHSQALKASDLSLDRYPGSAMLLIKRAQLLLNTGDPIEALRILNQVEGPESNAVETFLLKGSAYAEMGKHKEATRYFREALSRSYDDKAEVLHQIAYSFERQNDFKTAIRYLLEALELEPTNSTIIYDLAWCYDRLEEDEKAISYYKLYIDSDPFADHVWYNLAMVYSRIEDNEKAVEAFDYAIAIDSEYTSAYYGKANALASMFEFQKAIDVFNEYLFLDENNPDALISVGECYERLKNYTKAIQYYQRVIDLEPGYADAWFGMGVVYYFLEDYLQSVHFVTKAIEIHDEEGEYWFSLGNVLMKLDDHDHAIQAYTRATELDPTDIESWLNLSEIYYKEGKNEEAGIVLDDSYNYNFDNGLINYRLAAIHFLLHQTSDALQFFEKGLSLDFGSHHEVYEFYPEAETDEQVQELINKYKK
jgi:tetratricopeptide (TPR) repeat protein